MHIRDILNSKKTALSFEFFPTNTTEGHDRLQECIHQLSHFNPNFVSITYGAGGSTRQATEQWVRYIKEHTTLEPIPHLTCVNQSHEEIHAMLSHYIDLGISNVLALRGDAPKHLPHHLHQQDDFPHASNLVSFIREQTYPTSPSFGIGVAGFPEGHPSTPNRLLEIDYLKAKVDAGADYICTQLFFDNEDFYDYQERCELAGIHLPILAGVLPITTIAGLKRISQLAGRARIPARLWKRLLQFEHDPKGIYEIGLHHSTEQCSQLLHHQAAGLHFFTMNQHTPVQEILKRLAISSIQ